MSWCIRAAAALTVSGRRTCATVRAQTGADARSRWRQSDNPRGRRRGQFKNELPRPAARFFVSGERQFFALVIQVPNRAVSSGVQYHSSSDRVKRCTRLWRRQTVARCTMGTGSGRVAICCCKGSTTEKEAEDMTRSAHYPTSRCNRPAVRARGGDRQQKRLVR